MTFQQTQVNKNGLFLLHSIETSYIEECKVSALETILACLLITRCSFPPPSSLPPNHSDQAQVRRHQDRVPAGSDEGEGRCRRAGLGGLHLRGLPPVQRGPQRPAGDGGHPGEIRQLLLSGEVSQN